MRLRRIPIPALLATLAVACTTPTPNYCDATHPCVTPGTTCNIGLKTCVAAGPPDAGTDGPAGGDPTLEWLRVLDTTISEIHVAASSQGAAYVAGTFSSPLELGGKKLPLTSSQDAFFVSYGVDGTLRFAQSFGNSYGTDAAGVTVDGADRPFLVGSFGYGLSMGSLKTVDSKGGRDVFVAGFDPVGTPRMLVQIGGAKDDTAGGLVVDSGGHAIVAGTFQGGLPWSGQVRPSLGADDGFLVWFTDKQTLWTVGGTGADKPTALARDASDNVYVAGTFEGSASFGGSELVAVASTDVFVASFDSAGRHRFSFRLGGSSEDVARLCVGGSFRATLSGSATVLAATGAADAFVSCHDAASGAPRFAVRFGGLENDTASSLLVDPIRGVYVTGAFRRVGSIGDQQLTSAGGDDAFLMQLDATGELRLLRRFGGSYDDAGMGLAASPGRLYLSGTFRAPVDFGAGPVLVGSSAGFLLAFTLP